MEKFKQFISTTLLGGLTVVLPIVLLASVFGWLFNFVTNLIQPITSIIVANAEIKELLADFLVIVVILALFFIVGLAVKTRVGAFLFSYFEKRFLAIAPGYKLIKDTVFQILGNKKSPFSQVALAQIFENDTLVTVFITDEHEDRYTVFVPTGPNPTSGFMYHLKKKYVHPVNVPVEDAMRSVISCGSGSSALVSSIKN